VAVALVALVLLRNRARFSGFGSKATASASAPHGDARPRAQSWRPIYLSGGETKRVDARAIGAFEGQVVSTGSGRGVPDAELTFIGPAGAESTRAGADGGFRLEPAREGSYELGIVSANGFLPFTSELGSSPIVLTARRGSGISGVRLAL